MKKAFSILFYLLCITGYSQSKDYYVEDVDTVFCTNLRYATNSQSYLSQITFTDENGEKRIAKGKENLINIKLIHMNTITIDRIPQKANKPDSYIKWAPRIIDGKLIINYYHSEMTTYSIGAGGGATTTGITKFFIRMPDGIFYDIRKSGDRKKHIIPYLKQCPEFVAKYTGNYSKDYDSFCKTIALYNSLCH